MTSSLAHFRTIVIPQIQIPTQVHSLATRPMSISWYSAAIVWQIEVKSSPLMPAI